jgi:hypothetical protein
MALFHLLVGANGRLFRLYGDGIYPMMLHLLRPFIAALPGSDEAIFNDVMTAVRVSVEWSFGTSSHLDFHLIRPMRSRRKRPV